MNKIYLVKELTPWMMNELLAMSQYAKFRLVLLRNPSSIYQEDLSNLNNSDIDIIIKPFVAIPSLKKIIFTFSYLLKNMRKLSGVKNFVFTLKSFIWFLFLNDDIFCENSSIHSQFATQTSILAFLYKKYYKNIDFTFTFHAYDIYYNNLWFKYLVEESKMAFTISDYSVNFVKEKYNLSDASKIVVSRLGTPYASREFHNRVKLNDFLVLGFMGMFVKEKNILFLLQVVNSIVKSGLNLKLYLAGSGPMEEEINEYIKKNKLDDVVIRFGLIYGQMKIDFFNCLDVFVLTSTSEGLPVVLMEAISCSVPIIATDISGIPELCKNGHNGFLVEPNNAYSLATSIRLFYNMSELEFRKYKENAFHTSSEFDIINNSVIKLQKMNWA